MRLEMAMEPDRLRERVADLEVVPPVEMDQHLVALGYRGQQSTRRALVLATYRHVRRLRQLFVDGVSAKELGPRQNLLVVGPTGCGKTFLVETLFRNIVRVPTVVLDATTFSEVGYIGADVSEIPGRLVDAADGDVLWAQAGMVCMDEFDKLAASRSTARFAGAGTTKDISGLGTQRGLLSFLSSSVGEYTPERAKPQPMVLSGVTFIGCGAFSGLGRRPRTARRQVGFGHEIVPATDDDSYEIGPSDIERCGFLPELVGRFSRTVQVQPLSREILRSILVGDLLVAYRAEFASEGVELQMEGAVIEEILDEAVQRGHGARGLHSALAELFEEPAFDCFGLRWRGSVAPRMPEARVVSEERKEESGTRSFG